MDWRLRGLPPALWRRVRDKAGDRLRDVLLALLRGYADGLYNPTLETRIEAHGKTENTTGRSDRRRRPDDAGD